MNGLLVGGIIGEGLKSFVNSYNATQDRVRQQAESDEDRVERRRRTKLDEIDRGVKYNETTGEYEDLGDGRLNRTERQRIDQLQKSASSLGEQWGLKEYDPLRQELKALLTKGAMKPTGMLNAPTAPASVMEAPQAGATNRIPQMAPKAPRTVTMPRQVAPQTTQVPAASPVATPAAQPQVDPAYEKMAQQVLNAPIQGYNPNEWSTPPKFVREEMQRRQQKAQEIRMKGMEKVLEPTEKATNQFSQDLIKNKATGNAISSLIDQLEDPNIPEDQKIIAGRESLKLLNSLQGSDAVGAEEARRLGSLLEFHFGNISQPGPFIGRAPISQFTTQVKNNLARLNESIAKNQGLIKNPNAPVTLPKSMRGKDKKAPDFTTMTTDQLKAYVGGKNE